MLSLDAIVEICSYLDPVSIVRLSSTCKWYKKITERLDDIVSLYSLYFKEKRWDDALTLACCRGNWNSFFFFLDKGASNLDYAASIAILCGHIELAKFIISNYKISGKESMVAAVGKESVEMIKLISSINKKTLKIGIYTASCNGNLDLVKLFIELGSKNVNFALRGAAKKGHMEIVKFLMQCGIRETWYGLSGAIESERIDILDYIMENDPEPNPDHGTCIIFACERGNIDIVKHLIKKGLNEHEAGQIAAATYGHREIVEYFYNEFGTNESRLGMINAISRGHIGIVKFFVENGADDLDEYFTMASNCCQKDIQFYLWSKIKERNKRAKIQR